MTEKLVILEARVREETVAGTQASVEKIVEDVGGIVEDVGGIVENVKATVDTTLVAVQQGVAGAQASVAEIVEHVQGTVEDTVATVQRTFDLPSQVEYHPWPMFGGALLVGYMLGSQGGGRLSAADSTRDTPSLAAGPTAARAADACSSGSPPYLVRRPLVHSRSRGSSAAYWIS
jgi:hypothetical protein